MTGPRLVGIADDVAFELRLAQAMAWCAARASLDDPERSLRHEQLRPRVLEIDRATTVRTLAQDRERYVPHDLAPARELLGGRLLAYYPDLELSDGVAEEETRGFFDVNNAPPWDTWIALFREPVGDESYDYIVTWVPPAMIDLVGRGIAVNPEECIVWLADAQTRVTEALRLSGLLP